MRTWHVRVLAVLATLAIVGGGWLALERITRSGGVAPPEPEAWTGTERLVREQIEARLDGVRRHPRSPSAWLDLAFAYHANDLVDLAGPCYEQTIARGGEDARVWYLMARLRSELGDVPGAVEAAERAAALDDDAAFVHWRRGFWLLELGRIDDAEAAFAQAWKLAPFDPIPPIGLARVAAQRGDNERVVELLTPLVANDTTPNLVFVRNLLGTAYQRMGETARARGLLAREPLSSLSWWDPWTDQLAQHRRLESWIVRQAHEMIRHGEPDAAVRHLEPLLPDRADDPVFLETMSMALFVANRLDEAASALERLVEVEPDNFNAHLNLALTHERLGNVDRALAALDAADAVAPDRPEVRDARARLRGGS